MGDDEEDCDCMAGQFLCDDVRCLPGELWCNGVFDCQDGTDEAKCGGDGGGCNGDHSFICASGNEICDVQVCDGVVDCPTMDDETGCCPEQFRITPVRQCLSPCDPKSLTALWDFCTRQGPLDRPRSENTETQDHTLTSLSFQKELIIVEYTGRKLTDAREAVRRVKSHQLLQ
ncbi:hypothetical protein O3P69_003574 [Scylla paramamosain]|uniref:Uncharacterized protein n=1 Tax=Scylla paramamosain TaxID=85552 RepID=A0AAW0UHK4_SCYPA